MEKLGYVYLGMVAYAVIFIACYFIWVYKTTDKTD